MAQPPMVRKASPIASVVQLPISLHAGSGMWPYTYAACDVGTAPNQTLNGSPSGAAGLSYLPGQRLSACTCPGSDHPGPSVSTGRGAPEIDILEAQIDTTRFVGQVSQSLQVAPFNTGYQFNNNPSDSPRQGSTTVFNSYQGGKYQQAISALTDLNSTNYNGVGYSTYGYEWWSNPSNRNQGYIQWYSGGQMTWKATAATLEGDSTTGISSRIIPEEPMVRGLCCPSCVIILMMVCSISSSTWEWPVSCAVTMLKPYLMTLGIASFQKQDFHSMQFPAKMYIDYIRVYQKAGLQDAVGCSPSSHPTTDYINRWTRSFVFQQTGTNIRLF